MCILVGDQSGLSRQTNRRKPREPRHQSHLTIFSGQSAGPPRQQHWPPSCSRHSVSGCVEVGGFQVHALGESSQTTSLEQGSRLYLRGHPYGPFGGVAGIIMVVLMMMMMMVMMMIMMGMLKLRLRLKLLMMFVMVMMMIMMIMMMVI